MNEPGGIDRGPDDFAAGMFFYRDRFAGDHGFVDGAAAFEDDAIDGNFFAGAYAEFVAGLDVFERDVFFCALAPRSARRFRREIEESSDGGAGAAAGAEFQDLAEQDECGDGGRGFEVDVGISAHARDSADESGKIPRSDRCDHAVAIGDAGA